jgi:putative transcriptional regulator
MNNSHPNQKILIKLTAGELDDKHSLVVSAHTQSCGACKIKISQLESQLSENYFSTSASDINLSPTPDFSQIQKTILELKPKSISKKSVSVERITIKNKSVELPIQLNSLISQMQKWKTVGDKLSYCKIDVHGSSNLYFVYFNKGAKIPEHTHEGNEFVYVIAGSYSDELFEYVSGDFSSYNTADSHHPYTEDPDGCLLLVSLDGPFVFQEGWARLLNPFRRWFI